MTIQVEQISSTCLWVHDGNTNIMTIDTAAGVNIAGTLKISGETVSPSAAEIVLINGLTATSAELNVLDGVAVTGAQINLLAQGAAAGYKISRSAAAVTLDGANPTTVASGLTTPVAAFAQLASTDAPGSGIAALTANIRGTNIDVYAWKHSSTDVTTLIASTDAASAFYWMCVGA